MEASLDYLADSTDNYQYYIGNGITIHTILNDDFAEDAFYLENSAQNILFMNG